MWFSKLSYYESRDRYKLRIGFRFLFSILAFLLNSASFASQVSGPSRAPDIMVTVIGYEKVPRYCIPRCSTIKLMGKLTATTILRALLLMAVFTACATVNTGIDFLAGDPSEINLRKRGRKTDDLIVSRCKSSINIPRKSNFLKIGFPIARSLNFSHGSITIPRCSNSSTDAPPLTGVAGCFNSSRKINTVPRCTNSSMGVFPRRTNSSKIGKPIARRSHSSLEKFTVPRLTSTSDSHIPGADPKIEKSLTRSTNASSDALKVPRTLHAPMKDDQIPGFVTPKTIDPNPVSIISERSPPLPVSDTPTALPYDSTNETMFGGGPGADNDIMNRSVAATSAQLRAMLNSNDEMLASDTVDGASIKLREQHDYLNKFVIIPSFVMNDFDRMKNDIDKIVIPGLTDADDKNPYRVDIFGRLGLTQYHLDRCENILFIVCDESRRHFVLVHFHKMFNTYTIYDSMKCGSISAPQYEWIKKSCKRIADAFFPSDDFATEDEFEMGTCSQQRDSVSCGVYVVRFVEALITGCQRCILEDPNSYRSVIDRLLHGTTPYVSLRTPTSTVSKAKPSSSSQSIKRKSVSLKSDLSTRTPSKKISSGLKKLKLDGRENLLRDVSSGLKNMEESSMNDGQSVHNVVSYTDKYFDTPIGQSNPNHVGKRVGRIDSEDMKESEFPNQNSNESDEIPGERRDINAPALLSIDIESVLTLNGERFLNDEVIYASLLNEMIGIGRIQTCINPKYYFDRAENDPPYFSGDEVTADRSRAAVIDPLCILDASKARMRKDISNVLDYNVVLFPFCINLHWRLSAFFPKYRKVWVLDSLQFQITDNLDCKLREVFRRLLNEDQMDMEIEVDYAPNFITHQDDGYNCGILVCMMATNLLDGELSENKPYDKEECVLHRELISRGLVNSSTIAIMHEGQRLNAEQILKMTADDLQNAQSYTETEAYRKLKSVTGAITKTACTEVVDVENFDSVDGEESNSGWVETPNRNYKPRTDDLDSFDDYKPQMTNRPPPITKSGVMDKDLNNPDFYKTENYYGFFNSLVYRETNPAVPLKTKAKVEKEKDCASDNWSIQREHIEQYLSTLTCREVCNTGTRIFPLRLWLQFRENKPSFVDSTLLSSYAHLIFPITCETDEVYGVLVVLRDENSRTKGIVYDTRQKVLKKFVREQVSSFQYWVGLPKAKLSLAPNNVAITNHSQSGLLICEIIRSLINQDEIRRDFEAIKKSIESYCDINLGLDNIVPVKKQAKPVQPVGSLKQVIPWGRSQPIVDPWVAPDLIECIHCKSLNWPSESPSICCNNGMNIVEDESLYYVDVCAESIRNHLLKDSKASRDDHETSLQLNRHMAIGFLKQKMLTRKDLPPGGIVPVICDGNSVLNISAIEPTEKGKEAFVQIYYNNDTDASKRFKEVAADYNLLANEKMFMAWRQIFCAVNPYVAAYKSAHQVIEEKRAAGETEKESCSIRMAMREIDDLSPEQRYIVGNSHKGTLNLPSKNSGPQLIFNSIENRFDFDNLEKCIVIYSKHDGKSIEVPLWSSHFIPMSFPTIFPMGQRPFATGQKKKIVNRRPTPGQQVNPRLFMTKRELFRTLFARRAPLSMNRFLGNGSVQALLVLTIYHSIRMHEFHMIHVNRTATNVKRITAASNIWRKRAEQLTNIGVQMGKIFTLPAKVIGSVAYMRKAYHNIIGMFDRIGMPNLFITFTGSNKWDEIQNNLVGNDRAEDDPILVCRAFHERNKDFIEQLVKKGVFGKVIGYASVIEFQKRGMPHSHTILRLEQNPDVDTIDEIVRAHFPPLKDNIVITPDGKIPDPLHRDMKRVKDQMVHGPCIGTGGLCRNGRFEKMQRCAKRYPMPFNEATYIDDGHVNYARPDDGVAVHYDKKRTVATNRDVVPHNPSALSYTGSHANLDFLPSANVIPYIVKYLTKGADRVIVELKKQKPDEIANSPYVQKGPHGNLVFNYDETEVILNQKVMSAQEAAWFGLGYSMLDLSHTVKAVYAHLPGEQFVVYAEDATDEEIEKAAESAKSDLMCFFEANVDNFKFADGSHARDYTFAELAERCKIDGIKNKKHYRPYKKTMNAVCRLATVHPANIERYAIFVMLLRGKGFKSFDEMLSDENGVKYKNFQEAARKKGYLCDDDEWDECLMRATKDTTCYAFTFLFVTIMLLGSVVPNIPELFEKFKTFMYPRDKYNRLTDEMKERIVLRRIQSYLRNHSKATTDFGLPAVDDAEVDQQEIDDQHDTIPIEEQLEDITTKMNSEQDQVFAAVTDSLMKKSDQKLFFLQASGGCGKTFCMEALYLYCLQNNLKVMNVASSGIASTLLRNGKTAHSAFSVPINLLEHTEFNHDLMKKVKKSIADLDLLIWDEAPMQSKLVLNWVDKALRSTCSADRKNLPFGGTVIVLAGDWKQTFCIVNGVKDRAIIPYSMKMSEHWKNIKTLKLVTNMRVNADEKKFSEWLENVGTGRANVSPDMIRVPPGILAPTAEAVVQFVFPTVDLNDPYKLIGRAILTPTNSDALNFNNEILKRMRGQMFVVRGITQHTDEHMDEEVIRGVTEMEAQTPSGMPPHVLNLKVGAPIVLLRNLNLRDGMCNGARFIIKRFLTNGRGDIRAIECTRTTKLVPGQSPNPIIPRIQMIYKDETFGYGFKRRQFPIRLGFSMTINKAQGQTLDKVGIVLWRNVFSHGQLYVALSRVRSEKDVQIFVNHPKSSELPRSITRNIVYREILAD